MKPKISHPLKPGTKVLFLYCEDSGLERIGRINRVIEINPSNGYTFYEISCDGDEPYTREDLILQVLE